MNQLAQSTELAASEAARFKSFHVRPWLVGWLLGAVILSAMFGADALEQTFLEPDSAMRLVQVRDLIGGQGWFDVQQHRLNPPEGVASHWSRWVDAVLAAPIVLLSPIFGQTTAEVVVGFAWPLGLLAVFVFVVCRIARELAPADTAGVRVEMAAAILAALAFPALDRFAPGAFDHHNVVLALVLVGVWGLITMERRPLRGAFAGGALALAVITAAEALPFLALGALAGGIQWIVRPAASARPLFLFGCAVGATMLAGFLALAPPATWQSARCDGMSTSFLWIGLATAAVAVTLGGAPLGGLTSTRAGRLGAALALGAVAALVLAVVAPGCLGGGYGEVSPQMRELWLSQIAEARPLHQVFRDEPALFFALAGAALAGLVFAILQLREDVGQAAGWMVAAFLASGVLLMLWQVRGATFATAFAIPFAAVAIVRAQSMYRTAPSMMSLAAFLLVAATASAAGWSVIGRQVQALVVPAEATVLHAARRGSAQKCFAGPTLASLDTEPPGVLLNQFAIGSGVLAASRHAVLAAPYHRNSDGMMAAINTFRSSPSQARQLIAEAGATHVLVCDGLPEAGFYADHPAPGVRGGDLTLAAALDAGSAPEWLEPVAGVSAPLRLYRVRGAAGPALRGRH